MKKKLLTAGVIGILAAGMLTGCNETEESRYTTELMDQAYDTIGFPDVCNYFERQQLKEIYELRDDPQLICYWYTKNDMTGKWVYQGKCVGYGIPYTTSMTASESLQKITTSAGAVREVLPLAEPNGLYASPSTSATWILSVDEDGNITPSYVEDCITVTQVKMDARLCEDWSLTDDYEEMPDKAEINGEVNASVSETGNMTEEQENTCE